MKFKIFKIDAAVDQLDWAIKLFLDKSAYVSAITLAGAAEEIISGSLAEISASRLAEETSELKDECRRTGLSQPLFGKEVNWVRHLREMRDEEAIEIELETEAIQNILRAITNLFSYDQSLSSESPRFLDWLKKNKPEILAKAKVNY